MIPAPAGLVARYKYEHNGKPYPDTRDIVAFDDDGHPLIVGDEDNSRYLIRADTYSNYVGIGDESCSRVVAMIPADGWRIEWTTDDGNTGSEPLIGWGLKTDGTVVPLDTDSTGCVEEVSSELRGGRWRIYHRDVVETTPPSP